MDPEERRLIRGELAQLNERVNAFLARNPNIAPDVALASDEFMTASAARIRVVEGLLAAPVSPIASIPSPNFDTRAFVVEFLTHLRSRPLSLTIFSIKYILYLPFSFSYSGGCFCGPLGWCRRCSCCLPRAVRQSCASSHFSAFARIGHCTFSYTLLSYLISFHFTHPVTQSAVAGGAARGGAGSSAAAVSRKCASSPLSRSCLQAHCLILIHQPFISSFPSFISLFLQAGGAGGTAALRSVLRRRPS